MTVTRGKETMSKSTLTQAPTDPATVTPTEPTAPPTVPAESAKAPTLKGYAVKVGKNSPIATVSAKAPTLKGYAVKVGKNSPIATVRSAGIVFTGEAQIFAVEHEAMAELKNNPWLEVTEVTE